MIRYTLGAVCALLICAVTILAAEYKGKVKSVDADKNTITVTIDDKDKTFKVAEKDLKVTAGKTDVPDGLKGKLFAKNPEVTLVTTGEGDKEVVTEIRVKGGKKKDK